MGFYEVLNQVVVLLRQRGRVTYRALKREFQLDEAFLEDLKDELIKAQRLAVDEQGEVLVWMGGAGSTLAPDTPAVLPTPEGVPSARDAATVTASSTPLRPAEAERRQLTVLFCDLADSTRLARQLDPEDLREVTRAYQAACVDVIQRFAGYVAQYLGDGLLVYFGYPQAHEDDARRAARTGLGILAAMETLNTRLSRDKGVHLAVRIGIHTGLVVVGEMGSGNRYEHLALGDTPNLAARLQGLAAHNTVVISDATFRLVQGYVMCQDLGAQVLKGIDTPVQGYQVVGESAAQSRLDVVGAIGLTSFVGREVEVRLLGERWGQSTEGGGQVVLLSGEAGIGKSRLVHVLTERVVDAGTPRLTLSCSPYHTNSAFYPVIELLQRLVPCHRDALPEAICAALECVLQTTRLPLEETVPLVATLLSMPVPDRYPPLSLSPQRQKQKTQEALVAWLLAETTPQPVLAVWEDLHWADPSTLELLGLLLDQVSTARLLLILTCRPEFRPPWPLRSNVTQLTLTRLTPQQVEEMAVRVTGGKLLPADVVQQIVAKTDGIPLFVEELVKTILDAGLVREEAGRYVLSGPLLPLAIPATLQDALMARLDRLATAKQVAQLGATIGRTFAYDLVQAVALLDEAILQGALGQLVEAELVAPRGMPPQATYTFKHALIQDAAYQSLLRSTRQQYHLRIAQVMVEQFLEIAAMQPAVVAHHYTEAGSREQALPYWQQAGQQALQRSAFQEAVLHLTTARELLATLPETRVRAQQELDLLLALGPALGQLKSGAAPELEPIYARAWELCRHVGETPQLFRTLEGLHWFYRNRGALPTARELGEQLLSLAQRAAEPMQLLRAYDVLGAIAFMQGEYPAARAHFEQGTALLDATPPRTQMLRDAMTPGLIRCLAIAANTLWYLGFPAQAMRRSQDALTLAQRLAHPHSLLYAQHWAAHLYYHRREVSGVQAQADALLRLATAQENQVFVGFGICWQGWALAMQGQEDVGMAQVRQGMTAILATGQTLTQPLALLLLAEVAGHTGLCEEGLRIVTEALAALEGMRRGDMLTEGYRLQGELLLRQAIPDVPQAEACFQHALAVARQQQARSLELRAAMSLARLWQRQGKRIEVREVLAPLYDWFTEGFDTSDLREAKTLLEELA